VALVQCVRLGKSCRYIPRDSASRSGPNSTLQATGDGRLPSPEFTTGTDTVGQSPNINESPASRFPTAFFFDPELLTPLPVDSLSWASLPLASPCLASLGMDLTASCHSYVATTNYWLSILSPRRLYNEITQLQPQEPDPSLVLLLSCLRLVSNVEFSGQCEEYRLAKALSSSAENEGIISLRLIQSLVMLSVYEMGHGIYPAAYLTVGRAARLGTLAGLMYHDRQGMSQVFKTADTWTQREEERRAGWAIFMLDQFLHVGTDALPLMLPRMSASLALPINDIGWSKGHLDTAESSIILSSLTTDVDAVGRFATMCQAVHLFCHTRTHRDAGKHGEPGMEETVRLDEALQLHRTLVALDGRLPTQTAGEANLEAFSLVCGARFMLYSMYACREVDIRSDPEKLNREVEMQRESVRGVMDMAANRVPRMAELIIEMLASTGISAGMRGRNISFTVCHVLYHAATKCAWFIREGCGPEMTAGLTLIVSALTQLRESWDVASKSQSLILNPGNEMCLLTAKQDSTTTC